MSSNSSTAKTFSFIELCIIVPVFKKTKIWEYKKGKKILESYFHSIVFSKTIISLNASLL
jgi:hypothetical protein